MFFLVFLLALFHIFLLLIFSFFNPYFSYCLFSCCFYPYFFLLFFLVFHLAFLHLFLLVIFPSCSCLLTLSIWSKKGVWRMCVFATLVLSKKGVWRVCVFATLVWSKITMQHGGEFGTTRSLVTKTQQIWPVFSGCFFFFFFFFFYGFFLSFCFWELIKK